MKKIITYSYTILLILTCAIAFPAIVREVTKQEEDSLPVVQTIDDNTDNNSNQTTEDNTDSTNNQVTEDSNNESTSQTNNQNVDSPTSQSTETSSEAQSTATNPSELDGQEEISSTTDDDKTIYTFTTVSPEYFNDALFIGDSRTIGLYEYGKLNNATYFALSGLNVYEVFTELVSVPNVGKVSLFSLLEEKQYGKIYIMLGINELGYNFDTTVNKYKSMVEAIQEKQPNAIIYLQANLHVTKSRSDSDSIYNNNNINNFNLTLADMVDNQTSFYLDVNEIFDDENGHLDSSYTSDDTHVLGKHYADWCDWLATKAIVK